MSVHHTQCYLRGWGSKVEVPSNRGEGQAWEQNILCDLKAIILMYGLIQCAHVCVRVYIIEQMVEMYIKSIYTVGACATIKLA